MVDIPTNVPIKDLLLSSPHFFMRRAMNYFVMPLHEKILSHMVDYQKTLDLSARGTGKSRCSLAYATWYALKNPDHRILYLSDTDAHATRFLGTIRSFLEQSNIIHDNYGNVKDNRKWTDHELLFNTRTKIFTEANLSAYGMMSGGVTSGHFELIIIDDICNFDNSRTETMRERMKTWLMQTLMPTLMPGGQIHCVGTRYHALDTWRVVKDDLKFNTQIQVAIQSDGSSIWQEMMPVNDRIDEDGVVTDGLLTIQSKIGRIPFALQYQNDVSLLSEGNLFKANYIRYYEKVIYEDDGYYIIKEDNTRTKINKIHLAVDPAISKKDTADYTCIIILGRGLDDNFYVLDFINKRLSFNEQLLAIRRLADKYIPNETIVEDVSYQKSLIEELQRQHGLHVRSIKPTTDKVARATLISGFFESGRVHFLRDQGLIIDQLLLFPDGTEHDDAVDSMVYALWNFRQPSSPAMIKLSL